MPMSDADKKLVEDKVDAAVDINREIKTLQERLELLKVDLRVAAQAGGFPVDEKGNTVIRSRVTDNCATVCQVKDKPAWVKGVVRVELEQKLPSPVFHGLFDKEIVLGDNFEDAFKGIPKGLQKVVQQYVEWKPSDLRVNLSK
jgi:hypothetical protein